MFFVLRVVPNEKTRKKKIENGYRHRYNLGKSTIFSFRTELQKHAKTVTVTISLLMKTPFSFRTKLWKSTKTVTMISSKHFNEKAVNFTKSILKLNSSRTLATLFRDGYLCADPAIKECEQCVEEQKISTACQAY